MAAKHRVSPAGTAANLPSSSNSTNAISLDEAPRVPVGPGLEGRYGLVPLVALVENPHRVQIHASRQVDKLRRAIEVAGQLAPAVIDERFVILAGHARFAAAKALKLASMPVVQVFNLSEAQKRAFLLSDNRIGLDARLDRKALAGQIPELTLLFEEAEISFSDTGFEVAEIDSLVIDYEEGGAIDDTIDPALAEAESYLRRGDIFALGPHRLAIGDARDATLLERLMAGEKAEVAFLDPPYNVPIHATGGRGQTSHPEFAFASGEMNRVEFVAFLEAALGNAAGVSVPGAVHFVCMDWKHVRDLIEAGERVYGAYLNLITWMKTNAGQGGLYRNQHELIGVFRVGENTSHCDNVQMGRFGRNRSNVWTYPGGNTFRLGRIEDLKAHPTVKPVQLVADALKDVSRRDALVLDSFVGSGTTILAGEQVGRRVRAVEYEPRYAQIAIRRYEEVSGREAVHLETGLTLTQLTECRLIEERQVALMDRSSAPRPSGIVAAARPRVRERLRPPAS